MIAGLPGTGIGGLFYLMSALFMPIRELYYTVQGKSSKKQWKLVGSQVSLALGVIGGFWATGWALSHIVPVKTKLNMTGSSPALKVLFVKPFIISISVLLGVLAAIEIIGVMSLFKRSSLKIKKR